MADDLADASKGFDALFNDSIDAAREIFKARDSPFHQLGFAALSFLEAALGFETEQMANAIKLLADAEAAARKQVKATKGIAPSGRYPGGTEWELLHADATILLGLTHALSESYMGYVQCLYAVNNAHSKFAKLWKIVFPNGVSDINTPAISRKGSKSSLATQNSADASKNGHAPATMPSPITSTKRGGLFRGWSTLTATPRGSGTSTPVPMEDGPAEELIVSGTAFGYGVFQLILSLLPSAVKRVVGFFGLSHDRKLALRALAISASKSDVHSVFAGLTLMTYHGVVLLSAGFQADEAHILTQYRSICHKLEQRYPNGSLWILNRAKIFRMEGNGEEAMRVLRTGLGPNRPRGFEQAESLLVFELAWILLSHREYVEAAKQFLYITEINTWSHATYFFLAAGCYWRVGEYKEAQRLLDAIPAAIDKRKIGGKDLPFEVFLKKKLVFWKAKQLRLTGSEENYVMAISVNPAEEMGIFWNNHQRIPATVAEAHIHEFLALTPATTIPTPYATSAAPPEPPFPTQPPALDTPDELALRELLLGITHRTAGIHKIARAYLEAAHARQSTLVVNTWIGGVACFELACVELHEAEAHEDATSAKSREHWGAAIKRAEKRIAQASSLLGSEIDLSSRLESRIAMLKDEMALKQELLGL
ncbi:hypothetical protein PENSPDRAFT_650290 [Peniophora sp. CONT]|nr:hypothetical protein PENSPDRAFT_650290 [Peniophora sp. CONT]